MITKFNIRDLYTDPKTKLNTKPKKKKRSKVEEQHQIALIDWAKLQKEIWPYLIYIRNEGTYSIGAGVKAKRMGRKKGVSDLFFARPNKQWHGLWIELKSPNGRPSKEQLEWQDNMIKMGYYVGVYYNWQDAADDLIRYLANGICCSV